MTNKTGFFWGPDRDLTKDELEALMSVKAGVLITEWFYTKLESADLIEKGLGGWRLTSAGQYRLSAGK
jgi:hypothetical protein